MDNVAVNDLGTSLTNIVLIRSSLVGRFVVASLLVRGFLVANLPVRGLLVCGLFVPSLLMRNRSRLWLCLSRFGFSFWRRPQLYLSVLNILQFGRYLIGSSFDATFNNTFRGTFWRLSDWIPFLDDRRLVATTIWSLDPNLRPVSYTHLTLPTTPYV